MTAVNKVNDYGPDSQGIIFWRDTTIFLFTTTFTSCWKSPSLLSNE